jgi:hypothetical protein
MSSPTVATQITEAHYWNWYEASRADVEASVKTFYTYLAIHRLAYSEPDILRQINLNPSIWQTLTYSLQTTYFISLGRVFDNRTDSHSISDLLDLTIRNPWIFSRHALLERKRSTITPRQPEPSWMATYATNAWEPTARDLEVLRTDGRALSEQYKKAFKPIRHKVFAHKGTIDGVAIQNLFNLALVNDMRAMLRSLHTLIWVVWDLAWNARDKPLHCYHFGHHDAYVTTITREAEELVRTLTA